MQKRKAATPNGLKRRIQDLNLGRVTDPRMTASTEHPLPTLLTALVAGMVSKAGSLRDTEKRTDQMATKHGPLFGIERRIPDNTLGTVLSRLEQAQLPAEQVERLRAGRMPRRCSGDAPAMLRTVVNLGRTHQGQRVCGQRAPMRGKSAGLRRHAGCL